MRRPRTHLAQVVPGAESLAGRRQNHDARLRIGGDRVELGLQRATSSPRTARCTALAGSCVSVTMPSSRRTRPGLRRNRCSGLRTWRSPVVSVGGPLSEGRPPARPACETRFEPDRTAPDPPGAPAPYAGLPRPLPTITPQRRGRPSADTRRAAVRVAPSITLTRTSSSRSIDKSGMLEKIQSVAAQVGQVVVGKQPQIRLALACLLARGPPADRGPAGRRQDHARARAVDLARPAVQARAVHQRPAAGRHRRRQRLRSGALAVRVPPRARCSRRCCWPTRSTAPRRRRRARCSRRWRSGRCRSTARPWPLPEPFFVIATQNPQDQIGTFPLPESQLDRFLMCIELGYPDPKSERALLEGEDRRAMLDALRAQDDAAAICAPRSDRSGEIRCAPALLDYVQNLLTFSRRSPGAGRGPEPARRPGAGAGGPCLGDARRPQPRPARRRAGRADRRRGPPAAPGQGRRVSPPRARRTGRRAGQVGGDSLAPRAPPVGRPTGARLRRRRRRPPSPRSRAACDQRVRSTWVAGPHPADAPVGDHA